MEDATVEQVHGVQRAKGRCAPRGASGRKPRISYPFDVRLKAVKLYLEEGFDPKLIAREMGLHKGSVYTWAKAYREGGEAGLKPRSPAARPPSKPTQALRKKITEVKKQHPSFGVRRISQWLRRVLFLPASPETVRKTLHGAGLMPKTRKKPRRNPPRPRFFERSTPNQLWQSDIFTFRLGGRNAYLIGFVDDYSRYVVGLGLYRSQTAEHVLEVYRTAVGEYGVPKEQLTDNGRQYVNWRGKTRFQQELQKDRVHHILSRPHHPMTLGKVERFWKTIWEEYLVRAQFASFEEAQERVRYWVKYYNHRRPHQGLGGLCPADRFFQVAPELRKVMEQQIQENVLELAMKREPKDPFYVVGRMGSQSVVMTVEKGQFKMRVDGEEPVNEVNYPTKERSDDDRARHEENAQGVQREAEGGGGAGGVDGAKERGADLAGDGIARERAGELGGEGALGDERSAGRATGSEGIAAAGPGAAAGEAAGGFGGAEDAGGDHNGNHVSEEENDEQDQGSAELHGRGEVPGGAGDVDREETGDGAVPGAGGELEDVGGVAVAGDGGAGGGAGSAGRRDPERPDAGTAAEAALGPKGVAGGLAEEDARGAGTRRTGEGSGRPDRVEVGHEEESGTGRCGAAARERDPAGPSGAPDGDGRGGGAGGEPQDVLPVGEEGALGAGAGAEGWAGRPAEAPAGWGEGIAEEASGGTGGERAGTLAGGAHPGDA